MTPSQLASDIIGTYQKHGWQLRQFVLMPQTNAVLRVGGEAWAGVTIRESSFDGIWFSRPSHNGREAWELRLLAETAYALFETFEADEPEDLREDARLEMEAKMREHLERR